MGQDEGGSFSLADSKTNMLTLALSHRLGEIAEVLNTDLVPQLFALNGWTDEELPKFKAGDIEEVSMEEFSKLVQRVASVGLVEIDRPWLNKIREVAGIEPLPDDAPVDKEKLTGASSNSGKGMEVGRSGNGTAKIGGKGSGKDSSAGNNENAA
jgi:phage gp29-like protein